MFLFAVNHFFIIIFPRSSFEHIHLFAHSLQATRGKYKTDLGKTPRRQKQGSACVERDCLFSLIPYFRHRIPLILDPVRVKRSPTYKLLGYFIWRVVVGPHRRGFWRFRKLPMSTLLCTHVRGPTETLGRHGKKIKRHDFWA